MSVFEEFPQDDKYWKVEWLGKTHREQDDIYFDVYLIVIEPDNELFNPSRVHSNFAIYKDENEKVITQTVSLKIEYIQHVKIGSVWRNGRLQHNFTSYEEVLKIDQSMQDIEIYSISAGKGIQVPHTENRVKWLNLFDDKHYQISSLDIKNGDFMVVIKNYREKIKEKSKEKSYEYIFIPSSVIFQSCYVSSGKVAKKILHDDLSRVVDIEKSGFVEDEPRTFMLLLFKEYEYCEALTLANLFSDECAINGLAELRMELINSQQNNIRNCSINAKLPYSNECKLTVKGKSIVNLKIGGIEQPKNTPKNKYSLLVTEITRTKPVFNFDNLVVDRKNNSQQVDTPDKDKLPKSWETNSDREKVHQDANSTDNNDKLTNETPSNNNDILSINALQVIDDSNVNIIKKEKEVQKYRSGNTKNTLITDDLLEKFGAGEASSNGKVSLVKTTANSPVGLNEFMETLNELRSFGFGFICISIMNPSKLQNDSIINYFPRKIDKVRSWHLSNNNNDTRGFIVAEACLYGVYYYLLEIEPRKGSALRICLLKDSSGEQIPFHRFQLLFMKMAKSDKKNWSVIDDNWFGKFWNYWLFKHDRQSNKRIAHRIKQKMNIIMKQHEE